MITDAPMFRLHREPTQYVDQTTLFGRLSAEWRDLSLTAGFAAPLRTWSRHEVALVGYATLGEVIDAIDGNDYDVKDRILGALLRTFRAGDYLAGRTILQAFLPGLTKLACRAAIDSGTDPFTARDEQAQAVVSSCWAALEAWPCDRVGGITSWLLHRTSDAVRPPRSDRPHLECHPVEPARICEALADTIFRSGHLDPIATIVDPIADRSADLTEVLDWALARDAIDAQDHGLLAAVYLGAGAGAAGKGHLAAQLGISPSALRQRCSRAVRRIIDAVEDYIADGADGEAVAC